MFIITKELKGKGTVHAIPSRNTFTVNFPQKSTIVSVERGVHIGTREAGYLRAILLYAFVAFGRITKASSHRTFAPYFSKIEFKSEERFLELELSSMLNYNDSIPHSTNRIDFLALHRLHN